MTIPKMPERKEEELIANGTMHQAERELSRKIGWNERHDIAEKRNEETARILESLVAMCNELMCIVYPTTKAPKWKERVIKESEELLKELQPPEQSPKGEENK